jgi:hypothetical protein
MLASDGDLALFPLLSLDGVYGSEEDMEFRLFPLLKSTLWSTKTNEDGCLLLTLDALSASYGELYHPPTPLLTGLLIQPSTINLSPNHNL